MIGGRGQRRRQFCTYICYYNMKARLDLFLLDQVLYELPQHAEDDAL